MKTEILIDTNGKKRKHTRVVCDSCREPFFKPTRFLKEKNYCSTRCSAIASRKRIDLNCAYCGESFQRTPSNLGNSRSGLYFCSRKCKDTAQRIENGFTEMHPPFFSQEESKDYRKKAFRLYPTKCSCCGYNKEKVLQIHHIDGDRSNNKKENLIILCRNCHGEIHTGYVKLINRKLIDVGDTDE